jgi:hypothetical protein
MDERFEAEGGRYLHGRTHVDVWQRYIANTETMLKKHPELILWEFASLEAAYEGMGQYDRACDVYRRFHTFEPEAWPIKEWQQLASHVGFRKQFPEKHPGADDDKPFACLIDSLNVSRAK